MDPDPGLSQKRGIMFPEIVIAGCGNPLFADDGFGPAVTEELYRKIDSDTILVIDAGTSAPEFLFPMLDPSVTKHIIVIDTVDFGGRPGSLLRLDGNDIRDYHIHDRFRGGITDSLRHLGHMIDITLIGCQPGHISYPEYELGLSLEVRSAVPVAVQKILDILDIDPRASLSETISLHKPVTTHLVSPYQDGPLPCVMLCGITDWQ